MRYSRERQDDEIHEQVYGAAINQTANNRPPAQNRKLAACRIEHARPDECNRVMYCHTQSDRWQTAPESLHTNQSARNVLKHYLRCNPTQLVEDKIIRYVQRPGEQTDPQNRHQRSDLTCHRELLSNTQVVRESRYEPISSAFKVWTNLRRSIIDCL